MSTIDELEAQFKAAQAAAEAYSTEITAKYRQEMPNPADWRGPGPHPETAYERATAWTDAEREHLNTLRTAAREAAITLHRARQQAGSDSSGD